MNDTPETDYALKGVWYRGDHGGAFVDHARRMERERDEAMRLLCELKDATCLRLAYAEDAGPDLRLRVRNAFDAACAFESRMDAEKKIREGAKR